MYRAPSLALAAIVAWCFQATVASASPYCPNENVCFRWAVPETTSRSGSNNVYLQIKAPITYQWVALGIGSQMAGAEIFMIYQNGKGNVTLSTRAGKGHVMPEHVTRSEVHLLSGSGISNNSMVANIKCGDCSLDHTGSSSWIAAWKQGKSLNSADTSETIQEHDDYASFTVDLAEATTFSTGNPFVAGESTSNSNNSNNSNDSNNSGSSNNSSSGVITESKGTNSEGTSKAHGLIMALTFVIAYPVGAILMPMLGKWVVHAAWQTVAFCVMWIGFGLGYVTSKKDGSWNNASHVKLGVAVCILLTLQPILGFAHHKYFVKHQQRGLVSHAHIWYGRILMSLGIFNGGLGLRLAGAPRSYILAYSIFSIVLGVLYITGASIFAARRNRGAKQVESYQMSSAGYGR